MNVNAYMNVVNVLVNDGYIVALPKTEGGITPNHLEFAKDLLFLVNHLTENENALTTSLLYQTLTGVAAIGGHSNGWRMFHIGRTTGCRQRTRENHCEFCCGQYEPIGYNSSSSRRNIPYINVCRK